MNDNEQRGRSKYLLLKLGILLLIGLVFTVIKVWNKQDKYFWIDKALVDSGIYLTAKDPVYVTPDHRENVGKHFRIVCRNLKEQRVGLKGVKILLAQDIVSGDPVALLEDEPILEKQIEVDGLICGYYKVEDELNRSYYLPVMRVCSYAANRQTVYELAAPVQRVETPDVCVSEQGVSLTLERIEYRGVLCRVCFTVENQSEKDLYLWDMNFQCSGKDLGGVLAGSNYRPPYGISSYLEGAGEILPRSVIPAQESSHAELSILPFVPEDTLEIGMQFAVISEEVLQPDGEKETIDLELSCCPGKTPHI